MNGLNPNLLAAAVQSLREKYGSTKAAFVPSDAAAGGAPPPGGDAGGGMPPPPPGDPGAGGDMPPPPPGDPGAGGAMPPPPPDPSMGAGGAGMADPASIAGQVAMGVQQGMQASGLQGQGGKIGPNGKPQVKPDINTIATDVFQLKKMLFAIMRHAKIELPPDVLDGPNRDPMTGAPAESPTGGSDVQAGSSMAGPQSAIKPIEPMQGAFPGGGGGGGSGGGAPMGGMGPGMAKRSSDLFTKTVGREISQEVTGDQVMSKAAAVAMMCRRKREQPLEHTEKVGSAIRVGAMVGSPDQLVGNGIDNVSDGAREKARRLRSFLGAAH